MTVCLSNQSIPLQISAYIVEVILAIDRDTNLELLYVIGRQTRLQKYLNLGRVDVLREFGCVVINIGNGYLNNNIRCLCFRTPVVCCSNCQCIA